MFKNVNDWYLSSNDGRREYGTNNISYQTTINGLLRSSPLFFGIVNSIIAALSSVVRGSSEHFSFVWEVEFIQWQSLPFHWNSQLHCNHFKLSWSTSQISTAPYRNKLNKNSKLMSKCILKWHKNFNIRFGYNFFGHFQQFNFLWYVSWYWVNLADDVNFQVPWQK